MTKRAILYARVSTDDQADKDYSLPSQIEAMRKYAEREHFEIVAELREDHSGTTPIVERPEGKRLTAMLKAKEAGAVIVYQVDRLSRDIVNLLATVQMWIRAGIEIHTCDIGKIKSELDIVLVIKGWQGSDEHEKIIERTSRGRRTKAMRGEIVGARRAPYGYRFVRNSQNKILGIELYEPQAMTVRLIFEWYAHGDGTKPMTEYQIALRLSKSGVPPPCSAEHWKNRTRSGIWNISTVNYILGNETYAGVWRYGKMIGKNGHKGKRELQEQISIHVPAIISRDLWEQAQARRTTNKIGSRRNAKADYLLRGHVRCGCGYLMSGYSKMGRSQRHYYYRCNQSKNRFAGLETVCNEKWAHAGEIEAITWDYIERVITSPDEFEDLLREAQKQQNEMLAPDLGELEQVEALLARCDNDASECAAALLVAKGRVKEPLVQRQDEINSRYEALAKRRDELRESVEVQHLTDDHMRAAAQFREDFELGMKNLTFEDKREMLDALRVEVDIKGGQGQIKCLIPLGAIDSSISTDVQGLYVRFA